MKKLLPCPECEQGKLSTVIEDYEVVTSDGNRIIVPQVELTRCDNCCVTFIPAASSRKISEFQAQVTEQLTCKELYEIFERSRLNQKEFAESLGLGEKTFHRWLKGTQIVSRSMGYYLRAMDRFPDVLAWVSKREWRVTAKVKEMKATEEPVFQALHRRRQVRQISIITFNPTRRFTEGAIQHCGR